MQEQLAPILPSEKIIQKQGSWVLYKLKTMDIERPFSDKKEFSSLYRDGWSEMYLLQQKKGMGTAIKGFVVYLIEPG